MKSGSVVLVLVLSVITCVKSEAFSSTANLIQLVNSEKDLVTSLEAYIEEEESKLKEIQRYIDEIRAKNSSESSDALSYAGHPVNAYNLIKRWHRLSSMSPNAASQQAILGKLEHLPLPTQDDFKGAGAAILRLQRTFDLDTDDIAVGKIFNDDAKMPLAVDDFRQIGKIALQDSDYGLAAQWLEKILEHPSAGLPDIETYLDLATAFKGIGDFEKAMAYTKMAADLNPEDMTLDEAYHKLRIQTEQLKSSEPSAVKPVSPNTWKKFQPDWKENYEKLCRGEKDALQNPNYVKNLVCRYKSGKLPYVVYKEEILSWDPRIEMFHDVLSNQQAELMKAKAYPKLYRGRIGEPFNPHETGTRISKVAWLWDTDGPEIVSLSLKVQDITGLQTQYRDHLSSAEPFQIVNYGIGGQYEPHVDYYEKKEHLNHLPEFLLNTGDRIATFLFYLTDVKHGGATVFPRLHIRVPPTKNGAAFWYNAKLSGEFDKRTEHAGCPVLLGQKWAKTDKGKSEAFSSTANLVQLVMSEKAIALKLENMLKEDEKKLAEAKRYVAEIKLKSVTSEAESLQYVGHPVNAFNLIKRWYKLSSIKPSLKGNTDLYIPSEEDFTGALEAVIRLQKTFALKTDDIAQGKILDVQAASPLSAEDYFHLGRILFKNNDFDLAVEWLRKVVQQPEDDLPDKDTFVYLSKAYEEMGNISRAAHFAKLAAFKDRTDKNLVSNTNRLQHRLVEFEKNDEIPTEWERNQSANQQDYEKLCRGEMDALNDPEYTKDLMCKYRPGGLPYIVYKEEVLSWSPRISMFYDVMSDMEAEMLKAKAYPLLYRGTIGTLDVAKVSQHRVSKVAWLWDDDPKIKVISQRVKDCTGLETELRNSLSSSEPFQVVNYGIGGQYAPHLDFTMNNNGEVPDFLKSSGQRLATFLFYLTDVKYGGATVFPKLKIRVPPVKNGAAFWYNSHLSGEYDLNTEHAGCPVLLGQKWVSNKWIREYGQEFRRRCALTQDAVDRS